MTNSDKYIRDRLYNIEAAYPEDMWDRIGSNLPRKKDDRKLWLFFLLFLLTAMIPASIYISNGPSDSENLEDTIIPTSLNYEESTAQVTHDALVNEPDQSDNRTIVNSEYPVKEMSNHRASNTLYEDTQANNSSNNTMIPIPDVPKESENEELSALTPMAEIGVHAPNEKTGEVRNIMNPMGLLPSANITHMRSSDQYVFDPPECPTFTYGGESGLYIDFVYSHDYGMPSLSAKSQEYNPYVSERENTESPLYSFSAGVRIAYISSKGFGLKTGLNYSQINEKFEYLDPDASLIRTIITIDTLLVGGVPTVVSDTATIRIPGSLDITAYNRYKFIDIPILFTYEAYLTDKIYYNVNAGALVNLSFTQKGRFLDPAGEPVWFTSSDPAAYDAFNTSAGISLYGSLGLHYHLNPAFDLILEPNFRLFAGSLTNDSYPLNQKWLTGGLITGLRYKF